MLQLCQHRLEVIGTKHLAEKASIRGSNGKTSTGLRGISAGVQNKSHT